MMTESGAGSINDLVSRKPDNTLAFDSQGHLEESS